MRTISTSAATTNMVNTTVKVVVAAGSIGGEATGRPDVDTGHSAAPCPVPAALSRTGPTLGHR